MAQGKPGEDNSSLKKFKVCMLGAFAVGKTSLVSRYVHSIFDEKYHTTLGVKVDKREVEVEGQTVTLMVWDLAGEDDLMALRMSYLRGVSGCIYVVDGTRRETMETVLTLRKRVQREYGKIPAVIAFNKNDLETRWDFSPDDIEALRVLGEPVFETSARTGEGVAEAFDSLARRMSGVPS